VKPPEFKRVTITQPNSHDMFSSVMQAFNDALHTFVVVVVVVLWEVAIGAASSAKLSAARLPDKPTENLSRAGCRNAATHNQHQPHCNMNLTAT
jgi:hypothetical protein